MKMLLNSMKLAIFLAILSDPGPAQSQSCSDVNSDGATNIRDITATVNFLYKSGPPLYCPDPEITFTKSAQTLGNTRTFGLAIEDIDRDGDNDIFITNYIGASRLWVNDGAGLFAQSPQNFSLSEVHGVGIRDFNGDTYPDIFLLSHAGPSKVYFNDGTGSFTAGGQNIGTATDYPSMMALGDVDADGDIDAFIQYYLIPNRLWLNDGTGFFMLTATEYGGGNGGEMALEDLNGDSFPDLFLTLGDQPDEIWFNDGSGNFTNSGQTLGNSTGYEHVSSGDLEGDGDIDFAVDNSAEGVKIWLNQGNTGSFIEAGAYFEAGAGGTELLDADLDGDLDLITLHQTNGNILWRNNSADGYFESLLPLGPLFGSARALRAAGGKLDSDDDFDVVLGMLENNGGNPVYFNDYIENSTVICGDVNADCTLNIKDITYLIKFLYQSGPAVVCFCGIPILTTADAGVLTYSTAPCGGNVLSDNGSPVIARGVCWSTDPIPTIIDEKTSDGAGTGAFSSFLTGLSARTKYYARAYATNETGTGYGGIISFTTPDSTGTMVDIDGNVYQTIKIGNQWWMAENLGVTHYRDGTPIPNILDSVTWAGLNSGACCSYNNDEANVVSYGRIYNWFAASDVRNIAPEGWHVPSDTEWQTLINYLGGATVAGWKLKETGLDHWLPPNSGTNQSGFTARPGGYRGSNYALFADLGNYACFWTATAASSTHAWYRSISYNNAGIDRYDSRRFYGFSIRCVKD